MKNDCFSVRNYGTISILNNILKIFALNCVFMKEHKIASRWSLLTNVILILIAVVLNVLSLYYKFKVYGLQNETSFIIVIQSTFLIGFVQYLSDLYHVKKYGTKVSVQYYNLYENIDKLINMNYYGIVRKTIIYTLISFTILYCISTIIDVIAWYITVGGLTIAVYLIEYFYFIPKLLTILDAASHVMLVEYRLRTIGDMVEQYENSMKNKVTCNESIKKDIIAETADVENLKRRYMSDNILSLSRCYLLLKKQVNFINSMYGFRVSSNDSKLINSYFQSTLVLMVQKYPIIVKLPIER